eukprot:2760268-Pleurochrysis_carterae.AAC.1
MRMPVAFAMGGAVRGGDRRKGIQGSEKRHRRERWNALEGAMECIEGSDGMHWRERWNAPEGAI